MNKWLFLLFLCGVIACNLEQKDRNQQIAEGYCSCTSGLFELNKKASQQGENINFQEIQNEYNRAKTCVSNLLTRWGRPDSLSNEAMRVILQNKCPEAAQQTELLLELMQ